MWGSRVGFNQFTAHQFPISSQSTGTSWWKGAVCWVKGSVAHGSPSNPPHPSFTSNPSNILCVAHLTQYLFMCSRCVLKRNREVKFPEDFSLMIQLIDLNPAVSAFFDAAIMILPVVLDIHRWVSRPRLACHVLPHEHKPLGSKNHFRLFLTRSDLNYCWVHMDKNEW